MNDSGLIRLVRDLARLLHRRSSTPREEALKLAHRKIRDYAEVTGLSETWCDLVMLEFVHEQVARAA